MNVDAREVVLSSLRADLMNEFEVGEAIRRDLIISRRGLLFSEHALDAALARGATLRNVADAIESDLERFRIPSSARVEDDELRDALLQTLRELASSMDGRGYDALSVERRARLAAEEPDAYVEVGSPFREGEAREFYLVGMLSITDENPG